MSASELEIGFQSHEPDDSFYSLAGRAQNG